MARKSLHQLCSEARIIGFLKSYKCTYNGFFYWKVPNYVLAIICKTNFAALLMKEFFNESSIGYKDKNKLKLPQNSVSGIFRSGTFA